MNFGFLDWVVRLVSGVFIMIGKEGKVVGLEEMSLFLDMLSLSLNLVRLKLNLWIWKII